VQVVGDGEEAIAHLSGSAKFPNRAEFPLPALVLLDRKLPKVDGFEVLGWIRRQERNARSSSYRTGRSAFRLRLDFASTLDSIARRNARGCPRSCAFSSSSLFSGDFEISFVERFPINKHRRLATPRKIGKIPRDTGFFFIPKGCLKIARPFKVSSNEMRDVNRACSRGANSFFVKEFDFQHAVELSHFLRHWLHKARKPETSRPARKPAREL
jgi:hypothetical protein